MKTHKSKYPKFYSQSTLNDKKSLNLVSNMKIECNKCKKNLIFFDFLRSENIVNNKPVKMLNSVWYCNNKNCYENKKFKY